MKILKPLLITFSTLIITLILEIFFQVESNFLGCFALLLQLLSTTFFHISIKEKLISIIPLIFVTIYYLVRGIDSYQFSLIYVIYPFLGIIFSSFIKRANHFAFYSTIIILVIIGYYSKSIDSGWRKYVSQTNEKFPNIYLQNDNKKISIDYFKGKYVVLDFWFIGCSACLTKFPIFDSKRLKYISSENIKFYTVNVPNGKIDENIADLFLQKKKFKFDNIVTSGHEDMINILNIGVYPITLILDKNGNIIFRGNIEDIDSILDKIS
jgi:thiol-disulfide isomerase/thioredoxin